MLTRGFDEAAERLARGTAPAEVLDTSDGRAWIALDLAVREVAWRWETPAFGGGPGGRDALPPHRPAGEREPLAVDSEAGLAFALCHPDGRVREAALARADGVPSVLPLIAIRCADWVEPVRDRARALLGAALPGVGPALLPGLSAVILAVARRERGDVARESLVETLRGAEPDVLEAVLASEDRAVRRLAHQISVARGHFPAARLAAIAAADADVVIQDVCSEAALAAAGAGTGDDVLLPLLGSRGSRVRSAGVTALHRTGRHGQAEPFLYDRSPMVRACARWVLRQAGTDPLDRYRARCAEGREARDLPPGAPVGLAECGTPADAELLWPLTRDPRDGVRARAVAGLRLLAARDLVRLAPLLDDPAPGVVRETATTLVPWASVLPVEELTARLAVDRPRHVRTGAFRLLAACDSVECRAVIGRLVDDPDPKLRSAARVLTAYREPARAPLSTPAPGPAPVTAKADGGGRARRWLRRLRGGGATG
ncbi:hypothetical protein ACWGIN_24255 [Streptomyces sp. NPDC054861]